MEKIEKEVKQVDSIKVKYNNKWYSALTIKQIAERLGVTPVYFKIRKQDFLEKYGYTEVHQEGYIRKPLFIKV